MEAISIWFKKMTRALLYAKLSKNIYDKKRTECEQLNVNTREHQIRKVDDYISLKLLSMKETKCSCQTSKKIIICTPHHLLFKSWGRSLGRVSSFV